MNKIKQVECNFGAIAQAATEDSTAIDLAMYDNAHRFSSQAILAGSGTLDISYYISIDGINFVIGAAPIHADMVLSDSPTLPVDFTPPLCRWLKIRAVEKNVDTITSLRVILCIQ